ncbi:MAG: transposase [Betaproteobacteria bacterium]|nr:transposase [Betaproteobacteria bacterium]
MARLPRLVVANHLHHLIALSHHQQALFVDALDYQKFLSLLADAAKQHAVAVHAFALLPDRVHLLATPGDALGLSKMMQAIGRSYVPYFNGRHQRSGSLWGGRFRATVLDAASYFNDCAHVIEYLPVQTGASHDIASYPWSSYAHHAGLQRQSWLTDHPSYWAMGNTPFDREAAYQRRCAAPPDPERAEAITAATHKAWALGPDHFKASLGKLTPRRLQPARRGRPRRPAAG